MIFDTTPYFSEDPKAPPGSQICNASEWDEIYFCVKTDLDKSLWFSKGPAFGAEYSKGTKANKKLTFELETRFPQFTFAIDGVWVNNNQPIIGLKKGHWEYVLEISNREGCPLEKQ